MKQLEIYTKSWCPYCALAKAHLDNKGYAYLELDVTHDKALEQEMFERAGRTSVPQVFIDDIHVGGSDELIQASIDGHLDFLLQHPEAA